MLTKDELKHVNSLRKEWIYDQYLTTEDYHKEYDKITKKVMIQLIYEQMNESEFYLRRNVLKEDIEFLINNIKNNKFVITRDKKNSSNVSRLYNALLLFNYNYFGETHHIPSFVVEMFREFDINRLDKELDDFYYFLNGLLITRGKISVSEAKKIYEKTKPNSISLSFSEGIEAMTGNILNLDLSAYELVDYLVKVDTYFDFYVNENYKDTKYSFSEYLSYGKYGLNLDKRNDKKLYDIISNDFLSNYIGKLIEIFLNHLNEVPGQINQRMYERLLNYSNVDFDKATLLYNELIELLPRWDFKGATHGSVSAKDVRDFYSFIAKSNYSDSSECACGSGFDYNDCCGDIDKLIKNKVILEEEKAMIFYGIIQSLIIYANNNINLIKANSYKELFENLEQKDYIKLKDYGFENEHIISSFVLDNEKILEEVEYEIIEGILKSYKNTFIALEYIDQKLVLYDEQKKVKYLVSGIVSPISENISSDMLPEFVETRLIPLKDRIVYDVFINEVPFKIGPNIKNELEHITKNLKIISNINDFLK